MSRAIEVRELVKRFGELTAVGDISFEIEQGECVGLLGPNGAGKTTTVEILEGLQTPSSGRVQILGMQWDKNASEIRRRIGIQLQSAELHDHSSVEETLRLFRSLYPSGLSVREAIALVQLEDKRATHIRKLSGGQRQRLGIAIALVGNPELLFLDEPTSGLDPQAREAIWAIIARLKREGRTVLLTTHFMEEAEHLCDRIIIIDHGKIIAEGSPRALTAKLGGEQTIVVTTQKALELEEVEKLPGLCRVTTSAGTTLTLTASEPHRTLPGLIDLVERSQATLVQVTTRQPSLHDVFMSITGRAFDDDVPRAP